MKIENATFDFHGIMTWTLFFVKGEIAGLNIVIFYISVAGRKR